MFKSFDEPNLDNAIGLLRDQSQWPEGFQWDYSRSCRCAMGLFRAKWGKPEEQPTVEATSDLIGIPYRLGVRAFNAAGIDYASVTPEHVAKILEDAE